MEKWQELISNINTLSLLNTNLQLTYYGFYNLNGNYNYEFVNYDKNLFYSGIRHPLIFWKFEYFYMNQNYSVDLITNLTNGSSHKIPKIGRFNHIELTNNKLYHCDNPLLSITKSVLENNVYIEDNVKTQIAINNGYFYYMEDLKNQETLRDITIKRITSLKENRGFLLQEFYSSIVTTKFSLVKI